MTVSRVLRIVQRALGRAVAITAVLVVLGHSAPARADNVDELIQQLRNDDSDKVRLSAALNLTKLGNPRAILPLARALVEDSDANVRGTAIVLEAVVKHKDRVKKLLLASSMSLYGEGSVTCATCGTSDPPLRSS